MAMKPKGSCGGPRRKMGPPRRPPPAGKRRRQRSGKFPGDVDGNGKIAGNNFRQARKHAPGRRGGRP